MSELGNDIKLQIPIYIDNDLSVDDHGICWVTSMLYMGDADESDETRIELQGIIDEVIDFSRDTADYRPLFNLAHELSRQADKLRDAASKMEISDDSLATMYDLPDE